MNYLLFANPQTGSPILSELMKAIPPKVVVTELGHIDSWKRIIYRLWNKRLTVEDKLRFFFKIEFHDYQSLNARRLKRIIEKNHIEIGFITTFTHLIPKELFELFPKGLYNFHPSLLPKHGGANPFFWIIFSGDEYTGTTCYRVTEVLDHGDILIQKKYPVKKMDAKQLFNCYVRDIMEMIQAIAKDQVILTSSTEAMGTTEYDPKEIPKIDINDKNINKEIISKHKRALKPIV